MGVSHLNVDSLPWVSIGAMPSCLLDKLPTMDKYECLCGMRIWRFDTIDKLCENNLALAEYTMSTILDSGASSQFCRYPLLVIFQASCDLFPGNQVLTVYTLPDIAGDE